MTLRIIQVGMGGWGRHWAKYVVSQNKDVELVAYVDAVAEAQSVVDAAAQQGRVLMISQNYRYYPAVRAVHKLISEGTLGPVGSVNLDFRRYSNRAPRESNIHYRI